jgi:hypothetical protein
VFGLISGPCFEPCPIEPFRSLDPLALQDRKGFWHMTYPHQCSLSQGDRGEGHASENRWRFWCLGPWQGIRPPF